jgi:hypothetical protein
MGLVFMPASRMLTLRPDDADQHTDRRICKVLRSLVRLRGSNDESASCEQQQRGDDLQKRTAVTQYERREWEG